MAPRCDVQTQVLSNSRPRCSINLLLLFFGIGLVFILFYVYYMESFSGLNYVHGTNSTTVSMSYTFQNGGGVEDSASNANTNNYLRKYFAKSPTKSPTSFKLGLAKDTGLNTKSPNYLKEYVTKIPTKGKAPTKFTVKSVHEVTTTVAVPSSSTQVLLENFAETVEELTRKVYGGTNCPGNPRRKDLTRIMQAWAEIAKKHNIEYFIFYGSLLGSIRNREVTPYDHDIDVLMNVSYYPLLRKIAPKRDFDNSDGKVRLVVQPDFANKTNPDLRNRLNCRGKSVSQFSDWCSFQEPMARVLTGSRFLDIAYFYDKGSYIVDLVSKQFTKADIFPLKPCWLNGVKTYCPNKPEKLLKNYFSSDNLLPVYMCRDGKWKDKNGNVKSQLS